MGLVQLAVTQVRPCFAEVLARPGDPLHPEGPGRCWGRGGHPGSWGRPACESRSRCLDHLARAVVGDGWPLGCRLGPLFLQRTPLAPSPTPPSLEGPFLPLTFSDSPPSPCPGWGSLWSRPRLGMADLGVQPVEPTSHSPGEALGGRCLLFCPGGRLGAGGAFHLGHQSPQPCHYRLGTQLGSAHFMDGKAAVAWDPAL